MKETNFTHYEKEILNITRNYGDLAVVDGKPTCCDDIVSCRGCDFERRGFSTHCGQLLIEWLYQEYKEDKFITKVEEGFLESLGGGYIVRDIHGHLYWFEYAPSKVDGMWECYSGGDVVRLNFLKSLELPFIKNNDDPYSVEALLELEVR